MIRILIYGLLLTLVACTSNVTESDVLPIDLDAKKSLLSEKKTEMKALDKFIKDLEREIALKDPQVKQSKKVTTKIIERTDLTRLVEIQGSIIADEVVMASSEVGGRITRVYVDEGDYIQRGARIAKVDMESMRKQIEEVEKSLELTAEVFMRQERLWKQNIGSEIQFLQAKNNKERLEQSLETLRFNLTKESVYSPISGVVDKSFLKAGEMAAPGGAIVQILSVSKVKVAIDVPEKYLKAVRKGDKISIKIPTLETDQLVRISDIGRIIDPGNRTFKVEANISNRNGKIKPNLMVIAYLPDYKVKNAIAISSDLIQQEIDGANYVFIVNRDSSGRTTAEKRYVSIGESVENNLVISEGLDGAEELILDGSRLVNDKQEVQIIYEKEEENEQ